MNRLLKTTAILAAMVATAAVSSTALARPGDKWHDHSDWHKGGYVSHGDWDHANKVDYRSHHLRAPPRGYEWRQVNGNYVLAAVATGVIASIIANSH